jgi:inner membrane protein
LVPTSITHAVVGCGLTAVAPVESRPPWLWAAAAGLAMLPDLDVLAFRFGIPYGAFLGHRGFFHSLFFAGGLSLVIAGFLAPALGWPCGSTWAFLFVVLASHPLLDMFTDGGLGIAILSPFDRTRYFFPWRPIHVSPIGWAALGRAGRRALVSEIGWVWIPTVLTVATVLLLRS